MNKLVHISLSILEGSKTLMYEFRYDYIMLGYKTMLHVSKYFYYTY